MGLRLRGSDYDIGIVLGTQLAQAKEHLTAYLCEVVAKELDEVQQRLTIDCGCALERALQGQESTELEELRTEIAELRAEIARGVGNCSPQAQAAEAPGRGDAKPPPLSGEQTKAEEEEERAMWQRAVQLSDAAKQRAAEDGAKAAAAKRAGEEAAAREASRQKAEEEAAEEAARKRAAEKAAAQEAARNKAAEEAAAREASRQKAEEEAAEEAARKKAAEEAAAQEAARGKAEAAAARGGAAEGGAQATAAGGGTAGAGGQQRRADAFADEIRKLAAQELAWQRTPEEEAAFQAQKALRGAKGAGKGKDQKPAADAPMAKQLQAMARSSTALNDQSYDGEGPLWIVVGGEDTGGILARKGEKLNSERLPNKLCRGTTVMELEILGNRLHYKRICGDGPDWGWVNITHNGKTLLELDSDPPDFLSTVVLPR